MNIQLAKNILVQLANQGVQDYVVCAGARNAPFVKLLTSATNCQVTHFFDERAAAFFALGRSRRDQRPVAVVTTSGTAAAELLPATIEAYYSGVPLVLLTADRPKDYRGTGAPQTIEQVGLFSAYAEKNYDLDAADVPFEISRQAPTHLNVCFSEPLLDESIDALNLSSNWQAEPGNISADSVGNLRKFFSTTKRPLVILGALSASVRPQVLEFLQTWGGPVYAEAHSGLRQAPALSKQIITAGENILQKAAQAGAFDSILRFGSVPTLRLWRDLEDRFKNWPVLSVSDLPFPGLARENLGVVSFETFFQEISGKLEIPQFATGSDIEYLFDSDMALSKIAQHPESELGFVRMLSEQIPVGSLVMLGNSLPIREWDVAATRDDKRLEVVSQRGANGIDGLISAFLGRAEETCENWLVLGDLSAMYDLNALALPTGRKRLRIVVINNRGGQIFQPMFRDSHFLNRHDFEFSSWAKMFGWQYQLIKSTTDWTCLKELPDQLILELQPGVTSI
jgi:2-succinyl-5-enolpyruvyl-6-hydroxy-3-cyclohexene-1-carboxylate synthase